MIGAMQATDLETVRGWVVQLDDVIRTSKVAPEFKAMWRAFRDEVECIYQSAGHCASWLIADEYRRRVGDWLTMFAAEVLEAPRRRGAFEQPAAAETKERYSRAIDDARRALDEKPPAWLNDTQRAAYKAATDQIRDQLGELERRWPFAKTDEDRAAIARKAERLADFLKAFVSETHNRMAALGLPGNWGRLAVFGLLGIGAGAVVAVALRRR